MHGIRRALIKLSALTFGCATVLSCNSDVPDRVAIGEFSFSAHNKVSGRMIIPSTASPEAMEAAAREWCGERDLCFVRGWIAPAEFPRLMPGAAHAMSEEMLAYVFTRNRETGFGEESRWDCRRWPQPKRCLA